MTTSLNLIVNSRKFLRKKVTELHTSITSNPPTNYNDACANAKLLSGFKNQLSDFDNKFCELKFTESIDEKVFEDELTKCAEYDFKIAQCLSILENVPRSAGISANDVPLQTFLKSPTAPLPTFNENDDLKEFFEIFESTLDKFNYPEYDRFLLLKQQVKGGASALINSLGANKRTYAEAKSLLLNALASPDAQQYNLIKQITELKLHVNGDPYEFISKVKSVVSKSARISLTVDLFIRYFCWNGMNEPFKRHLIAITNKTNPSLNEIMDSFFDACDRFKAFKSKTRPYEKQEVSSSSFAANIGSSKSGCSDKGFNRATKFKPCLLCSNIDKKEADHSIYRCPKFNTPKLKVQQIKACKGCTLCGGLNHESTTCTYKFSTNCRGCNGPHMTYLCPATPEVGSNSKKDTSKGAIQKTPKGDLKPSVTMGCVTAISDAFPGNVGGNSLLPTFTCRIDNRMVRGLKDSGCQDNYVTDAFLERIKFKVTNEKVMLDLHGINGTKQYLTRQIEFEVMLGDKTYPVPALCLPSLEFFIELTGLQNVVQSFISKGYTMADEMLIESGDSICNVEWILGTRSCYILPETEVIFGKNNDSIYCDTEYGIMLKGEFDVLVSNLPYLPFRSKENHKESVSFVGNDKTSDSNNEGLTDFPVPNSSTYDVIDNCGNVVESELIRAANEVLNEGNNIPRDDNDSELNKQLIELTLSQTKRNDGRLCMPLMWNPRVFHLLGKNRQLSERILHSILKLNNDETIKLIDQVFREQLDLGIIEKIEDIESFVEEHPSHSFLPFMPVLKPERETTKCRVVFLSNLCQKDKSSPLTVSHNQAIFPGPCLNQKLSTSILHLRTGSNLCCFDLVKAFNQIELRDEDSNQLLFLWFRNIQRDDFSIIAFRNKRLPFGLRCSPSVLILGLYKMLILDASDNDEELRDLKYMIYQNTYMDNCAFSADDSESLNKYYDQVKFIFEPYKFETQQFLTNDKALNAKLGNTECDKQPPAKLLGMLWDQDNDTIGTHPIDLDTKASTKREILSTIASQYDIFGINAPLLIRSRLFMHDLQCQPDVDWDKKLSSAKINEWQNIAKQANSAVAFKLNRCVGSKKDLYDIIAFSDSSKTMYGTVLYLRNKTNQTMHFVQSKSKVVGRILESKTIPSLEMHGVTYAAECAIEMYKEMSGSSNIKPFLINDISVYTDSLVCLNWLISSEKKLDKTQKLGVFVANRIDRIRDFSKSHSINFKFISGSENPADCVTRPTSSKQLMKTNFYAGPDILRDKSSEYLCAEEISVTFPNPLISSSPNTHAMAGTMPLKFQEIINTESFSSFKRLVNVTVYVMKFVNLLKLKLTKRSDKYQHFEVKDEKFNYFEEASKFLIKQDQQKWFPEIVSHFSKSSYNIKDIPGLVTQLNLYMSKDGLLRVKCKLNESMVSPSNGRFSFPILLSNESHLSKIIVSEMHSTMSHSGCYSLLTQLRKQFWIPSIFSLVKKILRKCIICRRFNNRTIKLNQNCYREERLQPTSIPFRQVYLDYMGPFFVRINDSKEKVWVLCITCMWSRAVSLKVAYASSTQEFMRCFALHCFEYGVPANITSDSGSQLTAASDILRNFFKDHETIKYFNENGIKEFDFKHYFKGCSKLGALVEICVKFTKRLVFGTIRNNVLKFKEFEYVIAKAEHLVNRRPIAFLETLRDTELAIPECITPEKLIKGYDLVSLNVIPDLQSHDSSDVDWDNENYDSVYKQLQKVKGRLVKNYNEEFLTNLIKHSTSVDGRYKPLLHHQIKPGDIVLIKEEHTKVNNYPLAVVKDIIKNSNKEVTGAVLMKGKTREIVKRHTDVLIPYLSLEESNDAFSDEPSSNLVNTCADLGPRKKRKAAIVSEARTKSMLQN